jgi:hypothetical protein
MHHCGFCLYEAFAIALDETAAKLPAHHDFGWHTISSRLDRDGEEIGGMLALR